MLGARLSFAAHWYVQLTKCVKKGLKVLCNWNLCWKRNSLSFPPPVSHKFPRWEILWNSCLSFPLFSPMWGELISPSVNSLSPLGKHNSPIFHQFPPNFPRFPNNCYWFLLIPQFPVQFLIQLHKFTFSLSIRPISCILHVSLKMRIPHYARKIIINLRNSGKFIGILGKSDEKLFIYFSLVFPGVKYISLLEKSISPDFYIPWFLQWLPWKLVETPMKTRGLKSYIIPHHKLG